MIFLAEIRSTIVTVNSQPSDNMEIRFIDSSELTVTSKENKTYAKEGVNVNSICGYDRPPALHYSEPKTKR